MQFVIGELKGTSVAASEFISNTIRTNVSCNQCFYFSAEEETDILAIPLSPNINTFLSKFLKLLSYECKMENWLSWITNKYSIASLSQSSHDCGTWSIFLQQYSLTASINHWGTMESGHYWAAIKDWSLGG